MIEENYNEKTNKRSDTRGDQDRLKFSFLYEINNF